MASEKDEVPENPDIHFEPIISLPPVVTKTLEEEEEEMLKMTARLYRYDNECEPSQWKERGRGDVKILRHKTRNTCRLLMRRDKTLKICANHFLLPHMVLKPNCGSDRAWVWSTLADFADEEQKQEYLAIKLVNAEMAAKFKEVFDEAKEIMRATVSESKTDDEKVADQLRDMSLKDNQNKADEEKSKEKEEEKTEEASPSKGDDKGKASDVESTSKPAEEKSSSTTDSKTVS